MNKINLDIEYLENYDIQNWGEVTYARHGDSGVDLRAAIKENIIIAPTYRSYAIAKLIPAGIKCSVPEGFEIQIRPRSGLAIKKGITVLNSPGTIDSGFRDEIKIILINLGNFDFMVKPGMRVAQAVICPVFTAKFNVVSNIGNKNNRGGGFGHTGI